MPPKRTPASASSSNPKPKRARATKIPGVPSTLALALLALFKTPYSSSSLTLFLSAAQAHKDTLHHGVPDYLTSLAESHTASWEERTRAVVVLHAVLVRSSLSRLQFNLRISQFVDNVALGVGASTSNLPLATKLAAAILSMMTELTALYAAHYPRFQVAMRYLQERASVTTALPRRQVDRRTEIGRLGAEARRNAVKAAVANVDSEVADIDKVLSELEECFELLVPRFTTTNANDDSDGDDSDGDNSSVAWEEGESSLPQTTRPSAEHARRARQLVDSLALDELDVDLDAEPVPRLELQAGMLSRVAPTLTSPTDPSQPPHPPPPLLPPPPPTLYSALHETLQTALSSLRKHRFPRIKTWTNAIVESRAHEDPSLPPAATPTLHKCVQIKARMAAVLGKADRFAATHQHLLPPSTHPAHALTITLNN